MDGTDRRPEAAVEPSDAHSKWIVVQKMIAEMDDPPEFRDGEIWWCAIGMNIGSEVYGKGPDFMRPVVVIRKISKNLALVVPISTGEREGTWFHSFDWGAGNRVALLHQTRTVSPLRFKSRIAELAQAKLEAIREAYLAFLW